MNSPLILRRVVVKPSPIHGFGVFAEEDIASGEIIEEAYTLFYPDECKEFNRYSFSCGSKGISALVLGYGSIYNHSHSPNIKYAVDVDRAVTVFSTKRPIKKGEELVSSYGEDWFASRNIIPTQHTLGYKLLKCLRTSLRPTFVIVSLTFFSWMLQQLST